MRRHGTFNLVSRRSVLTPAIRGADSHLPKSTPARNAGKNKGVDFSYQIEGLARFAPTLSSAQGLRLRFRIITRRCAPWKNSVCPMGSRSDPVSQRLVLITGAVGSGKSTRSPHGPGDQYAPQRPHYYARRPDRVCLCRPAARSRSASTCSRILRRRVAGQPARRS